MNFEEEQNGSGAMGKRGKLKQENQNRETEEKEEIRERNNIQIKPSKDYS